MKVLTYVLGRAWARPTIIAVPREVDGDLPSYASAGTDDQGDFFAVARHGGEGSSANLSSGLFVSFSHILYALLCLAISDYANKAA